MEQGLAPRAERPAWKAKPFNHQRLILDFHLFQPYTLDNSEVGTGKTAPMVMYLWAMRQAGIIRTALVVAPNTILDNWANEIAKWSDLSCVVLRGTKEKRLAMLQQRNGADVYVLNYEGVRVLYRYLSAMLFDAIVCDEAHHIKNARAQQSKCILVLGQGARIRKAMTGTLLTNRLEDIWSIAQFVSPQIFQTNFWGFRARYLYDANAGKSWLKFPDWRPKPGAIEEIKEKLSPHLIRFEKKDVLKFLPPMLFQKRLVEMSEEQRRASGDLTRHFLTELKDGHILTAPQILARMTKLIEIANGFVYREGEKPYRFSPNPKIKDMKDLLNEIGDQRVVIWAAYREDIKIIGEALSAAYGESPFTLWGETDAESRQIIADSFNAGDNLRLVANPAVAGEGLTLLAPYVIWYSRSWKLGERLQGLGRHHRPGAERYSNVTVIDLIARGTMDERVMQALEGKEDLLQSITPESFRRMMQG